MYNYVYPSTLRGRIQSTCFYMCAHVFMCMYMFVCIFACTYSCVYVYVNIICHLGHPYYGMAVIRQFSHIKHLSSTGTSVLCIPYVLQRGAGARVLPRGVVERQGVEGPIYVYTYIYIYTHIYR